MRLLWEERAWEDYLYWQTQDKKTLKKVNTLIKDIQRNPFEGIGKPEAAISLQQMIIAEQQNRYQTIRVGNIAKNSIVDPMPYKENNL